VIYFIFDRRVECLKFDWSRQIGGGIETRFAQLFIKQKLQHKSWRQITGGALWVRTRQALRPHLTPNYIFCGVWSNLLAKSLTLTTTMGLSKQTVSVVAGVSLF
jgi:hypothetical protein